MSEASSESTDPAPWSQGDNIRYWVALLSSTAIRDVTATLAPLDLSTVQSGILGYCFTGEANTVTKLAELLPFDASAISRETNRLVERGLLRRRRYPNDRRVVRFLVTEKGKGLIMQVGALLRESDTMLLHGLTGAEVDAFIATIEKLLKNLENKARPQ